jgi:hypothetical protein
MQPHSPLKWVSLFLGLVVGLVAVSLAIGSTMLFLVFYGIESPPWKTRTLVILWLLTLTASTLMGYSSRELTTRFFSLRIVREK